jgi:hypothetical protein
VDWRRSFKTIAEPGERTTYKISKEGVEVSNVVPGEPTGRCFLAWQIPDGFIAAWAKRVCSTFSIKWKNPMA